MMKRISTILLIMVSIGLVMNFTFKNGGDKKTALYPKTVISGDETPAPSVKPPVNFESDNYEPVFYSDSVASITSIRTGPQSIYDLQSNGVPQQVWQDPSTPGNIHASFTVNLTPGFPAADRRCYYMFSSDFGATWTDYGPNPATGSNGFCFCQGTSDGSALIGGHTDNGSAPVRLQFFADIAPGAGTFTRLDPGSNPFNSLQNIWGRVMPTSSISNTIKFVAIGSMNTTADTVASQNRSTSLTTSAFSGYERNEDVNNAETYSFARANDGRIGLAYVWNDNTIATRSGFVRFTESTDNGVTWSAPISVYTPTTYLDGVYGCLRGVSITYIGTTPKIAFELLGITATGYYPSGKAGLGFWSPNVNGGTAVLTPFDSVWSNNGNGGATDVYTSICRPSIAKSSNEQLLLMTFPVSRADTDAIGSHFYDIYLTWSSNGGTNWKFPPSRLTNNSGPLRDNRFPSLSPTNDVTGGDYYANLTYQVDSIPGSVTQTPPAAESFAKQWFSRVKLIGVIGISTISTQVPKNYSLQQNYPNPFNPVTKIRFDLPQAGNVTLKVFNTAGQLVAVLANNEFTGAGVKELSFDGNGFASGVYFYSLSVGEFTQTKKMILVK